MANFNEYHGYLNGSRIRNVRWEPLVASRAPARGRSIPSEWMVKVLRMDGSYRWQRVYVTRYGNAGTAWVRVGSRRMVVPVDLATGEVS